MRTLSLRKQFDSERVPQLNNRGKLLNWCALPRHNSPRRHVALPSKLSASLRKRNGAPRIDWYFDIMYEVCELKSEIVTSVIESVAAFHSVGVQYSLIGGLATGLRSRPRSTRDVDFLLAVPAIRLPGLLDDLRERGFTFNERQTIEEYMNQYLTFLDFRGVRIDWMKPMLPLYQHVLDRASATSFLGTQVCTATAEGLILLKLIASRVQDIADINALLAANQGQLDLPWIEQEWKTLFDADDPRWHQYQQSIVEYYEAAVN